MKIISGQSKLVTAVIIGTASILIYFDFNVNTKEMLDIFIPLVWGVFIALGGSLIKLKSNKHLDSANKALRPTEQGFALYLIFVTFSFLFLATLFPARYFIKSTFILSQESWLKLCVLYDSACFSIFIMSSLGSIIVAAFVLLDELRDEKKETT